MGSAPGSCVLVAPIQDKEIRFPGCDSFIKVGLSASEMEQRHLSWMRHSLRAKIHLSLTPALPRSAWVTLGKALQLSDLLSPSVNYG